MTSNKLRVLGLQLGACFLSILSSKVANCVYDASSSRWARALVASDHAHLIPGKCEQSEVKGVHIADLKRDFPGIYPEVLASTLVFLEEHRASLAKEDISEQLITRLNNLPIDQCALPNALSCGLKQNTPDSVLGEGKNNSETISRMVGLETSEGHQKPRGSVEERVRKFANDIAAAVTSDSDLAAKLFCVLFNKEQTDLEAKRTMFKLLKAYRSLSGRIVHDPMKILGEAAEEKDQGFFDLLVEDISNTKDPLISIPDLKKMEGELKKATYLPKPGEKKPSKSLMSRLTLLKLALSSKSLMEVTQVDLVADKSIGKTLWGATQAISAGLMNKALNRNENELKFDENQSTALHVAVETRDYLALQRLLELKGPFKFSLDQQDKDGNTALHLAARNNDVETIQKLLAAGANGRIKNHKGKDKGKGETFNPEIEAFIEDLEIARRGVSVSDFGDYKPKLKKLIQTYPFLPEVLRYSGENIKYFQWKEPLKASAMTVNSMQIDAFIADLEKNRRGPSKQEFWRYSDPLERLVERHRSVKAALEYIPKGIEGFEWKNSSEAISSTLKKVKAPEGSIKAQINMDLQREFYFIWITGLEPKSENCGEMYEKFQPDPKIRETKASKEAFIEHLVELFANRLRGQKFSTVGSSIAFNSSSDPARNFALYFLHLATQTPWGQPAHLFSDLGPDDPRGFYTPMLRWTHIDLNRLQVKGYQLFGRTDLGSERSTLVPGIVEMTSSCRTANTCEEVVFQMSPLAFENLGEKDSKLIRLQAEPPAAKLVSE